MTFRQYLNPNARVGDVFGVFCDRDNAEQTLRRFNRNLRTHTVQTVRSSESATFVIVRVKGY